MKKLFLPVLGVLLVGLTAIIGCSRSNLFMPEYTHFEPAPIMVTSDQLYKDYLLDEKAAEAKYQGKQIWIIEARVDNYIESESGSYLTIKWFYKEIEDHEELVVEILNLASNTLQLESQYSNGFRDIGDGFLVEVVGECQGISEGVVTVKIDRIAKTGTVSTALYIPEGREY